MSCSLSQADFHAWFYFQIFLHLCSPWHSFLTLRYHFLRCAGLPPLFQQLSVCSFKSLLKTNIFQEIHPPPLSLIISLTSSFIISPLSCSLFPCQTFCECVCSDCSLSYLYCKYMLWNTVHIICLKREYFAFLNIHQYTSGALYHPNSKGRSETPVPAEQWGLTAP